MRKILVIMMAVLLVFGLAACSGGGSDETADNGTEAIESQAADEAADAEAADADAAESDADADADADSGATGNGSGSDTLVVYFSVTGNTKGVAKKIAAITGADIYEIKPAQEYTSDDIDWNNSDSRTTHEQNDPSFRTKIGSDPISLDGYKTIYIGYPIWWGEEPRIMDTFVETYDFDGITMIPFCTSGGSGIGKSGQNLADNAGSGTWLDGNRFSGGTSKHELRTWIDGLKK